MRLEILAGSENPVYYPINKPKMVIGSDLSCDIVVSEDEISRKHMILIQDGDSFYVVDQGSTNGSYLNEERLIPGRRVEFTSYFPVRLGSSVLMSLVSDEDAADEAQKISIPFPKESSAPKKNPITPPPRSDKTSVISLKDLQGSSTKNLVKKRDEIKKNALEGKNTKKKKKKKSFSLDFSQILAVVIIGGALYLTLNRKDEERVESIQVDQKTGKVKEAAPAVPQKPAIPTPPRLLTTRDIFDTAPKCSTEEEKLLCNSIPLAKDSPWGVTIINNDVYVMVNVESYWQIAVSRLPPLKKPQAEPAPTESNPAIDPTAASNPTAPLEEAQTPDPFANLSPEEKAAYEKELWEITIGLFIGDAIKTTEYQQLKGKTFNFAFFLLQEGLPALRATIAITPESLTEVRRLATPDRFAYIRESRALIMNFRESFYDINL